MRVHTFVDEGLGHSSYLLDLGDGTAALVDPPRFPTAAEDLAERLGLRLAWTMDTHSHADYVTGSPALAARTGAVFVAPAASELAAPHRPVADGFRLRLSESVVVRPVATPGHTPDHHAYVVEAGGTASAVFSGGSLMVGTVGRTDLCGAARAEPLAHEMFRSLRRFDDLTDDVAVYPTHGAGSFCSAPVGGERTSTLGRERATNPLFATHDENEFVERLLAGFGTFPAYFARLPELNRLGPTRYDTVPTLAPLSVAAVERHVAAGAVVVDTRPVAEFSTAHVPGSLSNTLRPVFASWLGWLIELDRPLVFVVGDEQDRTDVVRQCLDVGHERLLGELAGGAAAWLAAGREVASIPLVDPGGMAGSVVDVRQASEFAAGHVPGARNVELGALPGTTIDSGTVTVMCGHGERAMTGASILAAAGHRDVRVLDGGPDRWTHATGRPLVTGR